jgi:23S rRNA (guanosine2251-2'-O)-methyltransferase
MSKPYTLYGWHSVLAALNNPSRTVNQVWVNENARDRMQDEGHHTLIDPRYVRLASNQDLNRKTYDGVHQGIAAEVFPLEQPDLCDVLPEASLLLMLDQVTDPHNFGAIVRTAAAFSADAIIVQSRHSPPEGGVLAKSASGALEHIPIVSVVNLARALGDLKKEEFWTIAFDSAGKDTFDPSHLGTKKVLMMGAEGKGLRPNLVQHADILVRLPTNPNFPSLNVSNAAAIALYACQA